MMTNNGEYARKILARTNLSRIASVALPLLLLSPSAARAADPPTTVVESVISADGNDVALAMDSAGRIAVSWEQSLYTFRTNVADVFVRLYDTDGTVVTGALPVSEEVVSFPDNQFTHYDPSISVSADGVVRVGWIVDCQDCVHEFRGIPTLIHSEFNWGSTPPQVRMPPAEETEATERHSTPSVAISDASGGVTSWADVSANGPGVVWGHVFQDAAVVRDCSFGCFPTLWNPCSAIRSVDGTFSVIWSDAEESGVTPPFNIALRIYSAGGTVLAQRAGPSVWVNDPSSEPTDSRQLSPAVALDDAGTVLTTWLGASTAECGGVIRVFARRFIFDANSNTLRDPDPDLLEGRPGVFVVDSDPNMFIDAGTANPTVALKIPAGDPDGYLGSFVIAWVAQFPADGRREIRARYFDPRGAALAGEVRLNEDAGTNGYA
jgi:hypothetical protein